MHFSKKKKILATFPHLLALLPIPPLNIFIVWIYRVIFGKQSELIDNHVRENLNFQISYQIYAVILLFLIYSLEPIASALDFIFKGLLNPSILAFLGSAIGFIIYGLIVIQSILMLGFVLTAMIWALRGKYFSFPLAIRFFK